MYQSPTQQAGAPTFPNQQPVIGHPQEQGPHGQQPSVFTGQPVMGQQGQPVQYWTGQPVPPVQGQGALPAQPPLNQDEDISTIQFNKAYFKSGLNASRVLEFIVLTIAWSCVVVYSNRVFGLDGRANFFRGITIFCWVMVILFQIVFLSSISKNKNYFRQPSHCTLIALGIQVVLTILLIASSTSFITRLVDLYKVDQFSRSVGFNSTTALIYSASIFGVLASLIFLDDIRLLEQMYCEQKVKENASAGAAQQPGNFPQQQAGAVAQLNQGFTGI